MRSMLLSFASIWCLAALLAYSSVLFASDDATHQEGLLNKYDFDEYSRQPISFYYCQAGFRPDSYKPIYVWTREQFAKGTAVLRNSATGKTVSIPLTSHGVNIWGRQDWIADCSNVTSEGDYVLRAEFGGQSAETAPFTISKSCYAELQEKAAKHYFLKRCGIFCHTHDGYVYSLEPDSFGKVLRHVPTYGGWHDAHNDDKWVWLAWSSVYGLLKTQERFSPQWQGSNEPYPYCLAEAWWEVDWLLRMQKPDGTFYYAVMESLPSKDGKPPLLPWPVNFIYDDLHRDRRLVADLWGQNIDDLCGSPYHLYVNTAPKYFAYIAHVLRHCGRLMRPYDKSKAERCVSGAAKAVAYLESLREYPPHQELEVHAALSLYWLEEARDGGGAAALAKAEGHLKNMLTLQQPKGHFHASQKCRGLEFFPEEAGDDRFLVDYPFGYMSALVEYLEYAGQEEHETCELVDEVKAAFLRFARMLEGFCNSTVFRHPSEPRFDRKPAVIVSLNVDNVPHGYNPYIMSAGVVFAAAEKLAGYPGGQKLGQRQLHWILGANPRFMSFMNKVGVRDSGRYSTAVFNRPYHLRDMRWGVPTGMYSGLQKKSHVEEWRIQEWRTVDPRPNYPYAGRGGDGEFDCLAQETWLNCNGWLLLLLAQLEQ